MNKKDSDKKPIDLRPLQDYFDCTTPLKTKYDGTERPIPYIIKEDIPSFSYTRIEPTLLPDLNTMEGRGQYMKQVRDNHYASLHSIQASKNDKS